MEPCGEAAAGLAEVCEVVVDAAEEPAPVPREPGARLRRRLRLDMRAWVPSREAPAWQGPANAPEAQPAPQTEAEAAL